MLTHITYSSDSADQIVIPSGDYSDKTLEINAPKAEVNNSGQFKKVVINAIAENTYTENANNLIYFNAKKGRVIVEENAAATINLDSSDNQNFHLENKGCVNDLYVSGKAGNSCDTGSWSTRYINCDFCRAQNYIKRILEYDHASGIREFKGFCREERYAPVSRGHRVPSGDSK